MAIDKLPEDDLPTLVLLAQRAPCASPERSRLMNRVVKRMQRSGKIWRGGGSITPDGYEEALQKTWLYFCKNIDRYNPDLANVTTWFNNHLRFRILDYNKDQSDENQATAQWILDQDLTGGLDPVDQIPAPDQIPPILEDVLHWLNTNQSLWEIRLPQCPEVSCGLLISRRLPPETKWIDLEKEFGVTTSRLSGFYQTQCFPRLLAFGRSQGYLDF